MASIDNCVAMNSDSEKKKKSIEERVLEAVKRREEKREAALVWPTELGFPRLELGHVIVSLICSPDATTTSSSSSLAGVWKFLDRALSSGIVSSFHLIALLTPTVIAHRWSQPESFRLYLEILSRYFFSFDGHGRDDCRNKIISSVDVALQLSQTYGCPVTELAQAVVFSFFSIVIALIDSMLSDWGLQMTFVDKSNIAVHDYDNHIMDVDRIGNQTHGRTEHCESLRRSNSFEAFRVLVKLTEHKKAMVLLRLIYLNMPEKFNGLLQRMQFLSAHKLTSPYLKSASQLLMKLSENIQNALECEYQLNKHQLVGMLINIRSSKASSCNDSEFGRFACWAPFDLYMENAMDGKQFPVTSAIDILAETIYTLRVFNRASWHDTFLALWLSALRVVQRERDPLEGPVPHLEARLCILLSITPLAITRVLEKDDPFCYFPGAVASGSMENENGKGNDILRKQGLVSSLQVLGHYTSVLCPPASVLSAANNAAAKAVCFISNSKNVKQGVRGSEVSITQKSLGADMRHLIVEACLARNLIDTSAYFWPGYVPSSVTSLFDSSPLEICPWSRFVEGAPLTGSLINTLVMTPAASLVQVEKLYFIALNGSEEERSAAAKILCGASLSRGWNIQEHVVNFVVKLLSPPRPSNFTGSSSHLISYTSMLSAILFGASSVDTVHILSLHGVVPEVAASLMPLCETFGSLVPTSSHKSSSSNESSIYMVFSSAFLFLLRLWKFYRPPLEQGITARGGVIGGELTLEYLLLLRNSRIQSSSMRGSSNAPVYIDSYPKLRAWYCQNRSCIASTLSGLCSGNPVHQVANKILNMMYWKRTKSETISSDSSTQISSGATGPSGEDTCQRPILPAWEVLEAIPFVLEAILTACSHGKLSSRDLITGLRDLVDFLPASLATLISYFSAEVTRGIWKPVSMNGTDWPSPAVNLLSVESEIKDILAAVGVTVPSCSYGVSTVMLPLPMAILVSLTITFKLDKSLEYILAVAGPAMENCAAGCPWPSMPIVGSLWAQKIRRWHDFIVVSCSRSVFKENQEAMAQLLRSCFTSFLGPPPHSSSPLTSQNGVNGLLGNFISAPGHYPRVAPGFLYLRTCRTINDIHHLNNVIVELVANSAREVATGWASMEKNPRLRSNQSSLAAVVSRVKEISTLGSSLVCVAGGVQLVQELYQETIPTWLLSSRNVEKNDLKNSAISKILEGYSMAYLLVLSGACIWGVGTKPPSWAFSRRLRGLAVHMDFVVGVLDGNVAVGCDPAMWKAYVSCLVGLMVSFAPVWIRQLKKETLLKLATGLRGWHECELALALLERGGVETMGSVVQLLNVTTTI